MLAVYCSLGSDSVYDSTLKEGIQFYRRNLCYRFLVPGWRMGWIIIHDKHDIFERAGVSADADTDTASNYDTDTEAVMGRLFSHTQQISVELHCVIQSLNTGHGSQGKHTDRVKIWVYIPARPSFHWSPVVRFFHHEPKVKFKYSSNHTEHYRKKTHTQNTTALKPNVILTAIRRLSVTNNRRLAFPSANNYQGQLKTLQSVSVLIPFRTVLLCVQ